MCIHDSQSLQCSAALRFHLFFIKAVHSIDLFLIILIDFVFMQIQDVGSELSSATAKIGVRLRDA
jgi:hypothetical protein